MDYSRFFVEKGESFFWYFESLRKSSLQSFHCLLQGKRELEACAGCGMDVQIHGGLTRDGLAGRSPAAGAAPGARMLVHSIACGQGWRQGEYSGVEENERTLYSVFLSEIKRCLHSEGSKLARSWCPLPMFTESQYKTESSLESAG